MTTPPPAATSPLPPPPSRMPGILLRLEGLMLLGAAIVAYSHLGEGWLLFGLLILAPDVALLGYLLGPAVGARGYNLTHTLALPLPLLAGALVAGHPVLLAVGLIWVAHIGIDRALGLGLKYPDSFRRTHLQRV